jgi:FlaA1/EpsC-like NDP-sugar epimerase
MIKLAGYIPEKDIKIQIVGLRPGEKLYEDYLITRQRQFLLTMKNNDRRRNQDEFETLHADIEDLIGNANYLDNNEIVMRMKKSYQNLKYEFDL